MKTTQLLIRMDKAALDAVRAAAKRSNESANKFVARVLTGWINSSGELPVSDRLSDDYYVMSSGNCLRVLMNERGEMDEYPYDSKKAKKCDLPGKHPHRPNKLKPRRLK